MRRAALAALLTALAVAAAPAGAATRPPPGAATPQAERAVRWALTQIGVSEIGNTNCGSTIERWQRRAGWRVPPCREWCGAFVHEAFLRAGLNLRSSFLRPEDVLDDARARRRGLWAIPVRQVRRGDLVIYRWDTSARAHHFGIVVRRLSPGAAHVTTVDGNSGNGVAVGRRSMRYAVTGVRIIPPGTVRA